MTEDDDDDDFGPCLTLSRLAAVHSEVRRLIGLQSRVLHTWTINLHILWMAAFSNSHLIHNITRW